MLKRVFLLAVATTAALSLLGAVTADAHTSGGGNSIATAVAIPLNANVEGDVGQFESSYCCGNEYYKVGLAAGDHVSVRVQSAGDYAPCVLFFKPGTDDFNFNAEDYISFNYNLNGNHILETFIAPDTGTYVIDVTNDEVANDCTGSSDQWSYSFSVLAPHGLHLAIEPGQTVHTGTDHLRVDVTDALNNRVTDPNLTIGLALQWPGAKAKQVARAHVGNGVASFTFKVPASDAGQRVHVIAGAGDNINYVAVSTGRSFHVD